MSEPQVTLPWPPKELNPNQSQKIHWAKKNRIAQGYKVACWWACVAAKFEAPNTDGRIYVWLDFYPPDRRRRDEDNAIAAMKHGLDGVAKAIGVDDSRFKLQPFFHEQIGGMVKIRLTAGPEVLA
jgi:crossover junction endodeoxyribonuclease RusA